MRKSVRAVGRCAIKVEASADRCVTALLDLIQLNSADGGIGNRYLNCESTNHASNKDPQYMSLINYHIHHISTYSKENFDYNYIHNSGISAAG